MAINLDEEREVRFKYTNEIGDEIHMTLTRNRKMGCIELVEGWD